MLSYSLLKNHAGIMLLGDESDLSALWDVIHDVNQKSPLIRDKEGVFLALAYDARKAFQAQRHVYDHSPRYGVEMLWPVLLVQAKMLRESLAFLDSTKLQQAVTYSLEFVIESALVDDFGVQQGQLLIDLCNRYIDPANEIEDKVNSRGGLFCSWTKAQRKSQLPGLIESFDGMYPSLPPSNGVKQIPQEAFDSWIDAQWPDPKW